jgi:hypothetical protein
MDSTTNFMEIIKIDMKKLKNKFPRKNRKKVTFPQMWEK